MVSLVVSGVIVGVGVFGAIVVNAIEAEGQLYADQSSPVEVPSAADRRLRRVPGSAVHGVDLQGYTGREDLNQGLRLETSMRSAKDRDRVGREEVVAELDPGSVWNTAEGE